MTKQPRTGSKKAIAQAQRDAWTLAVSEGRVIRYFDTFKSYPTIEATKIALAEFHAAEIPAEIVQA